MQVSGQFHAPAALPLGIEPPGTHWIGGWVGPRVSLDDVEERRILHCRELNLGRNINVFFLLYKTLVLNLSDYWTGKTAMGLLRNGTLFVYTN
jgi:hypothetical protein